MTLSRWLLLPILAAIAAGLGYTVLSLPEGQQGLQAAVASHVQNSGVSNPVTAVLLNFRAYDTLLEMTVLLLAVMGVWSLDAQPGRADPTPGSVHENLTRMLAPLLILVSAYLLWVGAHEPGGAFQAGAVLSAAGILLVLAGWRLPGGIGQVPLRLILISGIATFIIVALGTLFSGRALLEYPRAQAGSLIMLIETAATVSIGITLTLLFIGTAPTEKQSP